jgi:hypothetical protein
MCLFRETVRISNYETSYTHEPRYSQFNQGQMTQYTVAMLLVCIRSYLKSVLAYKFLILDTYRLDTLFEQRCELFFEGKMAPPGKKFEKHCYRILFKTSSPINFSIPLLPSSTLHFCVVLLSYLSSILSLLLPPFRLFPTHIHVYKTTRYRTQTVHEPSHTYYQIGNLHRKYIYVRVILCFVVLPSMFASKSLNTYHEP